VSSVIVGRLAKLAITGLEMSMVLAASVKADSRADPEGFRNIVEYHSERFPAMETQDLYKLAFQAAMGSEHAVPSRDAARQWLERELSTLSTVPVEPFSEPLSQDGALVRVNLRAFVAGGGDTETLLDAFVGTASRFESSQEKLERYWNQVESMAELKKIPFEVDEVRELWSEMANQGFPTVRHSTPYREKYKPAYRVVLLDLLIPPASTVTGQ